MQSNTLKQHIFTPTIAVIPGFIAIVWWVLKYSAHGFDFTDESYYLVWMSNPWIYDSSVSQFGFIYHSLYILTQGNIVLIRQINIIITIIIAWILAYLLLRQLFSGIINNKVQFILSSCGLAVCVSMHNIFGGSWLSSPSYNSLTLQSIIITIIGVFLSSKHNSMHTSIFGAIIIGFGGWLCFMAKPTSALYLSIIVLCYVALSRDISINRVFITLFSASALLLASIYIIDGDIYRFVNRLHNGLIIGQILLNKTEINTWIRNDNYKLTNDTINSILIITLIIMIFIGSIASKIRIMMLFVATSTFIIVLVMIGIIRNIIRPSTTTDSYYGLIVFCLVISAIFSFVSYFCYNFRISDIVRYVGLFSLFCILPSVYSIGSANNLWIQGSSANYFYILASIALLAPLIRLHGNISVITPYIIICQLIATLIIYNGLENPYRQSQSLILSNHPTHINQHTTMYLSSSFAEYVTDIQEVTKNAKFVPKTPVIDLTGQSPGVLYIIEAQSIGAAWILGSYPGSANFAVSVLQNVRCETLSQSWILIEDNGPRSITTDVLHHFGASFIDDYRFMGQWSTVEGVGGYKKQRIQQIYAPIAPDRINAACYRERAQ